MKKFFFHGRLLSVAQTMKWCQGLSFKRKTNDHIWYHTWFPWDVLLLCPAKPNKIMYYILFYVIFTIRPWQWWLILLQWNLYVFNQNFFLMWIHPCTQDLNDTGLILIMLKLHWWKEGWNWVPNHFQRYLEYILDMFLVTHRSLMYF